jgi:hypothetical protein
LWRYFRDKTALINLSDPSLNNHRAALYCATLYFSLRQILFLLIIAQNKFVDSLFIKKLATDFGNRFFNAYNFKNTKDSLPIAWHFVCQPIKTPISDLQLLLLGINAHINCDLYDALLVNYLPSNKKNIAHDFFLID